MKNMKKLFSLALALVMMMALVVTAGATPAGEPDPSPDGVITIKNATIDETYKVYKIFDATYGTGDKAAYTINYESDWYSLVDSNKSLFTLTQIESSGVYNVEVKEDITADEVKGWINNITLPKANKEEKARSTTVTFDNLGKGYFLVTSTLDSDNNPSTTALITLTNATPDATIIDKNQKPGGGDKDDNKKTITKVNDGNVTMNNGRFSAQIGDTVSYEIRTTATNYDEEKMIESYTVVDEIKGNGLVLADNPNIVVKIGTKNSDGAYTYDDLTNADDYTLTVDRSNKKFTVNIPWVKTENEQKVSKYGSPVVISISYDTKVTADIEANDEVENEVTVTYGWDVGNTTEDKLTESLYTYALAIKKTDKSGSPLPNAKFNLSIKGNSTNLYFIKSGNVYTVADATAEGATQVIETDSNGLAVIKGVKEVEYTLTETEAPDGYNKLTAPITVTPKLATEQVVTKYLDDKGEVTDTVTENVVTIDVQAEPVVVVNFTGTELPSTGGIGTTIFTVVGGVLMIGAAILFLTKKRSEA